MSTLNTGEQNLYDTAQAASPRFLFDDDSPHELTAAFAKIFYAGWVQGDYWVDQVFILKAVKEFLDQLAKDKGTRRQENETDVSLASRLRSYEDALTKTAILALVNAMLLAAGVSGTAKMVETRADGAYFNRLRNFSRGDRMITKLLNEIIVILPYGTDSALANSILTAVNQVKAAGVVAKVEVNLIP